MKAADKMFYSLCEEIDYWREESEYWKNKYKNEVNERDIEWNERNKSAMIGVKNALMFALSVQDDENGGLIINKENRKILAESFSQID